MYTDRDQRTLNKYQIVFDAQPQTLKSDALDQLDAEIDRVLKRRNVSSPGENGPFNARELQQSNMEVKRVLGMINKSKFQPKRDITRKI